MIDMLLEERTQRNKHSQARQTVHTKSQAFENNVKLNILGQKEKEGVLGVFS